MELSSNDGSSPRQLTTLRHTPSTIGTSITRWEPTEISIVVPTRNEAGNIMPLIERLSQALAGLAAELIFVDDSDDDTVAVIQAAQPRVDLDITLIHRPLGQRDGGLGSAVVTGLRAARSAWVGVMDADLQHPPDIVPQMRALSQEAGADLVIASRYWGKGDARGLNRKRTFVSRFSAAIARLLFPSQLRAVTDPMSGFFLVRKDAINIDELRPRGFKILLEILVRNPHLCITEIGFEFGQRYSGDSKASLREGMHYLGHLSRLRFGNSAMQFVRFLAVGLSGLLVNTLVLAFATELLGMHYLFSAVVATESSTLWNFKLTEHWVFLEGNHRAGRKVRMLIFFLMNNAALLVRGPIIYLLTNDLGLYYIVSNLISLIALTVVRYAISDKLIWGRVKSRRFVPASHSYDIHGVISVVSEVALPELEKFRVEALTDRPNIRVRTGLVKPPTSQTDAGASGVRHIYYDEGIGVLGFGLSVTLAETIDVLASPILRWSPHVLYTNVVEPILRWTFVERGYALVHGACIAFGDNAYMVTARTDTGKTTTILRRLDRQRRATDKGTFLSDDLTLVAADRTVLTYPKPMTISHHTVAAINTPRLSRVQRLTLPLQSRLHSREGRRFAFWLSHTKLPVATINTIAQLLIPPPKYHVQQLVPHARMRPQGQLAGLIIIERGGEGDVHLSNQEALELLLANCDDAYGFPPYDVLKTVLHSTNERDLRAVERDIIAQALSQLPTTLLRSTRMDWSQRIIALVNAEETRIDWHARQVGGELEASI